MSTPSSADVADPDADLTRLLRDRADAIHPRGTSAAQLARRAGRIRRRRRTALAGAGLAASAAVAAIAVTRPVTENQRVEAGLADAEGGVAGSTVPTDGLPAASTTPTTLTIPLEVAPLASGPALRLGLDPDVDATVRSAFDNPAADLRDPRLGMTVPQLFEGEDGRSITVLVSFPPEGGFTDMPSPHTPAGSVDLGDGTIAELGRTIASDASLSNTVVTFEVDGVRISVSGNGTTDDELLEVARGVSIDQEADDASVGLDWMPADLTLSDWFAAPNMSSFPIRSSLGYDLASGERVEISVSSRADDMFEQQLAQARATPDPVLSSMFPTSQVLSTRTVRGVDAVVTAAPGTTQISWVEPSGNLVRMFITSTTDTTTVPDAALVDSLVELDEATFQELVATHPAP